MPRGLGSNRARGSSDHLGNGADRVGKQSDGVNRRSRRLFVVHDRVRDRADHRLVSPSDLLEEARRLREQYGQAVDEYDALTRLTRFRRRRYGSRRRAIRSAPRRVASSRRSCTSSSRRRRIVSAASTMISARGMIVLPFNMIVSEQYHAVATSRRFDDSDFTVGVFLELEDPYSLFVAKGKTAHPIATIVTSFLTERQRRWTRTQTRSGRDTRPAHAIGPAAAWREPRFDPLDIGPPNRGTDLPRATQ
jgi:hypothetical protein